MKNKFGIIIIFLILICGTSYYFLNNPKPAEEQQLEKIQITTSFYPLYFFTSEIVGDKAVVYNITPAGAEPHDYEPTAQDLARIEDSQLLILNGGKFEGWGDNIKNILKETETSIITVGDSLIDQDIVEDGKKISDPHIWLDPKYAISISDAIATSISKIDPVNANYYKNNRDLLFTKLDNLHIKFYDGLAKCQKKDIITSHTAFGYMAREYGFNQVAISGLSPDEEPSSKQLAEVTDFAKKNQVTYIFFESLVSPKLSETIAHEVGAQTLVLNPIEGLAPEEMRKGKNYITEMEQNLINLKIALECK